MLLSKRKKRIVLFLTVLSLFISIILLFSSRIPKSIQEKPNIPTSTVVSPSPSPTLIPGKHYVIGQTVVKFRQNVPQHIINEKLNLYHAKIIDSVPQINVFVLQVPQGAEQEVADKLIQDGIVEYAERNSMYEENWIPNDTEYSKQWALPMIKAPEAWDITKGNGVIVAAIENGGAELSHPDLLPNLLDNSGRGTAAHGTKVAGCITAATNNNKGISGTCPECKLLMFNITGYSGSNIAKAITTAADRGAKVISMSFGGSSGVQTVQNAINYGWGKGLISVASAGNEGRKDNRIYPANFPNVVSVSATDRSDKRASFANYGSGVTITAPGVGIRTTTNGGGYANVSGTSFSAPMTAGVIGLIWSTSYGTSPEAVVKRLCDTADKITGTGIQWKCGRVNAFAAVRGATGAPGRQLTIAPRQLLPQLSRTQPSPIGGNTPTPYGVSPRYTCLGSCKTIPATLVPSAQNPLPPKQPGGDTRQDLITRLLGLILWLLQLLFGGFPPR